MRARRKNKFNQSHVNSTTGNLGYIIPIMLTEAIPGDVWQGDNKVVCRFAPLVAPVMHEVEMSVYTFFVANRLLWDNWESFITGGRNGDDASVPPFVNIEPTNGSLADYFGLPIVSNSIKVSALPFRAMALIYNDYFRDQDLQDEIAISLDDGEDSTTSTALLKANWQKDYFTTARPWPQKGDAINIPLGDSAKVYGSGQALRLFQYGEDTNTSGFLRLTNPSEDSGNSSSFVQRAINGTFQGALYPPTKEQLQRDGSQYYPFIADLSNASTITVDELREAFAYQRMSERAARTGSRYEDLLHAWGLRTQDSRLQRPELISIRRSKVQFSEVLQTSPNSGGDGVGEMFGHGISALRSGRWRYYIPEHGFLMSFLCVRPKAVYTQGIERMWTRETRYDYWHPELQHIGQQEVLNKEIYADGTDADDEVFGYQNRYDELRRGKNHVTGEFRSTLSDWNMARIFENRPNLNSEFITCNPTDRIFQATSELADQMYLMVRNDCIARRLLSRNGNPI